MSRFAVTVRIGSWSFCYTAIAKCSADAVCNAIDCFGIASITATPGEVHHA